MDTEKFEKNMAAFTFGQHQDFITYLNTLATTGHTLDEARDYVKNKKAEMPTLIKRKINCVECKGSMFLYEVNTHAGNQTGESNDTFVWLCQNQNCLHTIYVKETIKQIEEQLKRGK